MSRNPRDAFTAATVIDLRRRYGKEHVAALADCTDPPEEKGETMFVAGHMHDDFISMRIADGTYRWRIAGEPNA